MKTVTKKAHIFRERVKDRHTSHWDLDMLSRAELEALMTKRVDSSESAQPLEGKPKAKGS